MANSVGLGNSYQKEIYLSSDTDTIIFYASPEIDEAGNSIYISLDDIRAPASIMIWMGSPSRNFNISAKLISRTQAEAAANVEQKNLIQAWRMPLGNNVGTSSVPEVLTLSGYGNQFQQIPVVVQSYNIQYPTDVDYIDSGTGFLVPIVWPISISLREFHDQDDMASFDYSKFKSGQGLEFWS